MKLDRIFHPSDLTQDDDVAFAHALRIAVAARARFQLLHVKGDDEHAECGNFPRIRATLAKWGMLAAEAAENDVANLGLRIGKALRTDDDPGQAITKFIIEHRPDLLVLATHQRHGLDRMLHESTAESVAHQARAASLFVPRSGNGFVNKDTGEVRLRTMLIPLDRAPSPQAAVDAATLLGRTLGCARLHLVLFHVGSGADRPSVHLPAVDGWTSEYQVWAGHAADLILTAARIEEPRSDLIVMSTTGQHGFLDALRGSTTERVLHGTPCPLLAVPAND